MSHSYQYVRSADLAACHKEEMQFEDSRAELAAVIYSGDASVCRKVAAIERYNQLCWQADSAVVWQAALEFATRLKANSHHVDIRHAAAMLRSDAREYFEELEYSGEIDTMPLHVPFIISYLYQY